MDRIVYLDYVAVPIYTIILYAAHSRKMVSGASYKWFMMLISASLATALCDCVTGSLSGNFPISDAKAVLVALFTYLYYVFHILVPIFYLLFLFSETRTGYWMTKKHNLLITFSPYFVLMLILFSNLFTGLVFTVDTENGYQRGPLIYAFYIGAAMYSAWGISYLIRRKNMLSHSKWFCLLIMYILNGLAVLFQLIYPQYLVEMIFTAFAELFIVLLVLRPEDYIDYSTEMPSYRAFTNEIRKITSSVSREKIIVMRFINARELQQYLGEEKYLSFMKVTVRRIKQMCDDEKLFFDMYFEPPGRLYIIIDNPGFDFESKIRDLYAGLVTEMAEMESTGARIIPRFCEINYPEDTTDAETIFNIGHQFHRIIPYEQLYTYAKDIIGNDSFRVKNNLDRILKRAINEKSFEMYYQPIYSIKERRFISAEALIRLNDSEFGFISPGLFIPAAERKGLMIPIGDFVLESVFRFISENDFPALGLSYIELNLSVAQCVQGDLSDKILALEKKYHVNPERVNLEITETTYEKIGETTDRNIRTLSDNGFSFSLDDYGTGYSNMQRISKLPLKIIKIDKTLVDDMANKSGMCVLENTVNMMKEIRKEIVCEGVETADQLELLSSMGVDFIQGFYFSKPLPEDKFVEFIKEKNGIRTA